MRYYEIARSIAILIGTNERRHVALSCARKVAPCPINHVQSLCAPELIREWRDSFDQEGGISVLQFRSATWCANLISPVHGSSDKSEGGGSGTGVLFNIDVFLGRFSEELYTGRLRAISIELKNSTKSIEMYHIYTFFILLYLTIV